MQIALISLYGRAEATGLRILSAVLKRAGFTTRLIFLPSLEDSMAPHEFRGGRLASGVLAQVTELCGHASLIGLGLMTANYADAVQVTAALRSAGLGPVIWGGIHPTVCPEECLRTADLVCLGEGEACLLTLAQRLADGADYHDAPNLGYVDAGGQIRVNPLAPLVTDLDALPFPDYDCSGHFILHDGAIVPLTHELMYYYLTDHGSWARGPVYPIFAGRGCPYRCSYCVNDALAGIYPGWNHVRRRSVGNVIGELQAARRILPQMSAVNLRDDTFLASSREYIAEFGRRYAEEIGLPFRAYTTALTTDPVKLGFLLDAGLHQVIMGIQTGSADIGRLYRRSASAEDVLKAAAVLQGLQPRIGRPIFDVITDNPYETRADRFATLELIHRLPRPYRLSVYSLTFFPGTELAARARADGLLDEAADDPHRRNIEAIGANYYNFALFCHSWQLPRPLLNVLAAQPVFDLLTRRPLDRLFGALLRGLLALRLLGNRRLYARRRRTWLVAASVPEHG